MSPVSFHTPLLLQAMTRKRYFRGAKIAIERLPVVANFLPVRFLAFQLVL